MGQVLSCHHRLGSPLPPRDASRLALFISSGFHPSTFELHESILASLADIYIHHPSTVATPRSVRGINASDLGAAASGGCDDGYGSDGESSRVARIWKEVWTAHGCLSFDDVPATLERVRSLETLGTVGSFYSGTMELIFLDVNLSHPR